MPIAPAPRIPPLVELTLILPPVPVAPVTANDAALVILSVEEIAIVVAVPVEVTVALLAKLIPLAPVVAVLPVILIFDAELKALVTLTPGELADEDTPFKVITPAEVILPATFTPIAVVAVLLPKLVTSSNVAVPLTAIAPLVLIAAPAVKIE